MNLPRRILPISLTMALIGFRALGAGSIGCAEVGRVKYSEILRAEGIEFVLSRVEVHHFAEIVKRAQQGTNLIPGVRTGISKDTPEGVVFNEVRYDMSLIPLNSAQMGLWANYLISSGDMIVKGVRIRSTFDFTVGLIFPVEIFDLAPFFLTSNREIQDRRAILSGLSDTVTKFSSNNGSAEAFKLVLKDLLAQEPRAGIDNFDANSLLRFNIPAGIDLENLSLLWIPAPLLRWINEHPNEFFSLSTETRQNSLWKLQTYPPVQTQVSRGNIALPPLKPRTDEGFSPTTGIGSWYTVVPDWKTIKRSIEVTRNLRTGNPVKMFQVPSPQ